MKGLENGLVTASKPDDAGTLIFGITLDLRLD
jgi:hypothetical protein